MHRHSWSDSWVRQVSYETVDPCMHGHRTPRGLSSLTDYPVSRLPRPGHDPPLPKKRQRLTSRYGHQEQCRPARDFASKQEQGQPKAAELLARMNRLLTAPGDR